MKWKFAAIAFLMAISITRAQDLPMRRWMPTHNRIGLALGIGTVTYQDKNTSPLIYRSRPTSLRLFYNLESDRFLFSVDLDLKLGSTAPKYHPGRILYFQEADYEGNAEDKKFPAGGTLLAGRLGLGAYYKVAAAKESALKLAVGARVSNELFYPQGWTSSGMFNALSLGPEMLTQYRANDHHSFSASVRLPMTALLARLPYDNTVSSPNKTQTGGFFSRSQWVGLKKFAAPTLTLGYNYQFNPHWGAGLNYELGWYRIEQPQTMKAVNSSFLANFYHQF
ncbi:MAG TPA: hypothetical protein PKE06_12490 [Flavilitoribacter sp.]|nr:hypothetical protein [Flavilitoribacter sp.]HMQ89129.1 hypothetical protein [Flavilitoribacter sp.]